MTPINKNPTRRDFLKVSFTAGGALLIASYLEACTPTEDNTAVPPTVTSTPEPGFEPNLYIKISKDGKVTLTIHRSEMGQGVRTSLAMILAEELEAKWDDVHVEQLDVNSSLNQVTSGSGSILINYDPLREAGATARQILIAAAAKFWGVAEGECKADQGSVIHSATNRSMNYGELVQLAMDFDSNVTSKIKDPAEFRLIGTSIPRVDGPDIVSGKAIYGLDVRLPGMLYAVVARCPVLGGKVVSFDSSKAESFPGVRAVVEISRGVAVVAENTWAAIQGRAALDVTWDEGPNSELSTETIRQKLAGALKNSIEKEAPVSLTTIEAIYETPFLAHATMEPVNCVADVRADYCDIWAPTQNPLDVQSYVRNIVKVPTDVHVTLLGGGFGRKLEVDFAIEAAEISKAIAGPVQVVWTREDDIQHDFYRQITYHWVKAGWDDSGKIQYWRHFIAAPGINGIAYRVGKEVLDEGIGLLYDIPNELPLSFLTNTPVPTGPWRGVLSSPNAFANECFLDEVASALKRDPYELRMEYLDVANPVRELVELAATKANWGAPLPDGHALGIASQTYHQSTVVMVAEVSVEDGVIRVHKVVCTIDCGRVINPDMVIQQTEGSIVFGLSTLKGAITYEKGRVQQNNFYDYPLLQLSGMPEVEVYVLPSENPPQGLGEMGVPPIVPAVLNAVFAATGKRIRHTPVQLEDLQ